MLCTGEVMTELAIRLLMIIIILIIKVNDDDYDGDDDYVGDDWACQEAADDNKYSDNQG